MVQNRSVGWCRRTSSSTCRTSAGLAVRTDTARSDGSGRVGFRKLNAALRARVADRVPLARTLPPPPAEKRVLTPRGPARDGGVAGRRGRAGLEERFSQCFDDAPAQPAPESATRLDTKPDNKPAAEPGPAPVKKPVSKPAAVPAAAPPARPAADVGAASESAAG
jgi:hypothetical protein